MNIVDKVERVQFLKRNIGDWSEDDADDVCVIALDALRASTSQAEAPRQGELMRALIAIKATELDTCEEIATSLSARLQAEAQAPTTAALIARAEAVEAESARLLIELRKANAAIEQLGHLCGRS